MVQDVPLAVVITVRYMEDAAQPLSGPQTIWVYMRAPLGFGLA